MKRGRRGMMILFGLICVFLTEIMVCEGAFAGDWRYPLALTYASGYGDVVDLHEDNLEAQGYIASSFQLPVGISFHPYYEFDSGFRIGGGIGPYSIIMIDTSGGAAGASGDYYDFPVNLTVGYTFMTDAETSPYVRLGLMNHFAGGDFVEDKSPGLFAAAGIEFMRKRNIGFGFEVGYDSSKITFQKYEQTGTNLYGIPTTTQTTKEIEPYKMMISLFMVF